jgi:hypothetical protein
MEKTHWLVSSFWRGGSGQTSHDRKAHVEKRCPLSVEEESLADIFTRSLA